MHKKNCYYYYCYIAAHETKIGRCQGVLVHEPYVAEQEEDTKLNLCVKNEVDINIKFRMH